VQAAFLLGDSGKFAEKTVALVPAASYNLFLTTW